MKWIFSALFLFTTAPAQAAPEKFEITWEMAHEPGDTEYRAQLEKFGEALRRRSNGALDLKIKVSEMVGGQALYEATNRLYRGDIQMSQVRTGDLALFDPDLTVMNAPFLFRDHQHAALVMDGAVGNKLLASLQRQSRDKLRAFAFTYSGGFRQISGNKEVRTPADLHGFKMLQPGLRTSLDFFDLMGAKFTGSEMFTPDRGLNEALISGAIDGAESEYVRSNKYEYKKIKYVNETNHALYITVIVANNAFYASLPKKWQKVVSEEVQKLAHEERAFSIQNAEKWKQRLIAEGVQVIVPTPAQREQFVAATKPLYDFYAKTSFGPYIKEIRAVKGAPLLGKKADGQNLGEAPATTGSKQN